MRPLVPGKSTLAKELASAMSADLVSLDAINEERGLRGGEGVPVSEWAYTNEDVIVVEAEGRPAGVEVLRMVASNWQSGGKP